ncbi:MAG: HAD family hydrolase [Bryobacterales bacterium]|nr:HAD family hydrolase [Bryobacterales bacterium]
MSRPCVFLDRDGVINEKAPEGEYIESWSKFRFLPNIIDWIRLFNALDHMVIIVTNQRGVARGFMTEQDLVDIHEKMCQALAEKGARIDDIFYCPHEEGTCDCRKPRPGLVRRAVEKWDIDLSRSLLIGDSERDTELAQTCGLRFLRANAGRLVYGRLVQPSD